MSFEHPMSTNLRPPKVSIVLLNLNGYADTSDCIKSLEQIDYPNYEVIVVDNGSSDGSGERLAGEFPGVRMIVSKNNLGFTGGNNLGMQDALQRGADYVLLLNNDTVVDRAFLSHLVQVAESDPTIGLAGPKIYYFSEPERIWYAGGDVNLVAGACDHAGKDELDTNGRFSKVADTGFITGCAFLVKARVLRHIGLLDDKLFVYWEDTDFCERARKQGYRRVFVPQSHVWHKVSRTCGKESYFTLYLSTRNQLNWVATHAPYPIKPFALGFTLAKKTARMIVQSMRNKESAVAVAVGIWHFARGIYGPPRKKMPQSMVAQPPPLAT
jgi:GT2 family glycosyltransferase